MNRLVLVSKQGTLNKFKLGGIYYLPFSVVFRTVFFICWFKLGEHDLAV